MVGTRAGFLASQEVVEVRFDPAVLPYARLLAHAERHDCARNVFTTDDAQQTAAREVVGDRARPAPGPIRPDGEPKYYLFQSPLRSVPMTELQALRVNARIQDGSYAALLSPRQQALLDEIRARPDAAWPNVVGREVGAAWDAVADVQSRLRAGR